MKYLVFIAIAVCIVGVGVAVFVTSSRDAQHLSMAVHKEESEANAPNFVGFSFEEHLGGEKCFRLKADKATIENRKIGFFQMGIFKIANMEKVELAFYNNNEVSSVIDSDYAVIDLFRKDVTLWGNVQIISGNGCKLTSNKVKFLYKDRLLLGEEEFNFKDKEKVVKGKGFSGDIYLAKFSCDKYIQ
ncbi:MAG: LPS export ABC transporter periplasmic protein LptC [Candidatus Omnitrophota bacterium]